MAQYRHCDSTGKKMFASLGEAKDILTQPLPKIYFDGKRVKRRMGKRIETRAYYCDDCKHWHLTSKKHFDEKRKNKF